MPPQPRNSSTYPRLLAACTLPPVAASAHRARATVMGALPDHLTPEDVDTVELLTCELVTNAIRHAATACRLRLSEPQAGVLRVEVDDEADFPAALSVARPPATGDNGRGLQLVDALAAAWGTDVQPTGKTVWFDLHV
jgi:two-component sensor histidine kinase